MAGTATDSMVTATRSATALLAAMHARATKNVTDKHSWLLANDQLPDWDGWVREVLDLYRAARLAAERE